MSANRKTAATVALLVLAFLAGCRDECGNYQEVQYRAPESSTLRPMVRPSDYPLPSPDDRTTVGNGYWVAGRDLRPGIWTTDQALGTCTWSVSTDNQDFYLGGKDVRSVWLGEGWTLATQGCGTWRYR